GSELIMNADATGRTKNKRRAAPNTFIVGLLFLAAFNAAFHTKILGNISSAVDYSSTDNDVALTLPRGGGERRNKDVICPDVWGYFFDEHNATHGRTYLEDLWNKSNEYHNLGGNYKALSDFMDKSVDATYNMVGLTPFTLEDGKSKVGSSVQEFIRGELRKNDDKNRGGYYQRNFPGKFTGQDKIGKERYKSLFENGRSITSVMEPVTVERWDIAMGPTLEMESCLGFRMLKKRWDQTKYLCGWDRLLSGSGSSSANHTDHMAQYELDEQHNQEEHERQKSRSLPSSCNVISIGSNDQWAFEEDMAKYTACSIHTFDCTITNPKKKPDTDQVQFHSVCITGDPNLPDNSTINGRKFATYFDLLDMVGLTHASGITYLKIDVEGYEWDVFINMIRQAKERNLHHLLPQQIMVELHYATWMYDLPWAMRAVQTGELMSIFSMMFREAGYMSVYNEKSYSPMLREVLLIKVYC
ncbi:hypothetical protein ACHAWF_003905, partial [Thalassiosira exigua]